MPKTMNHWNGNQLCAIDIETTGLNPRKHEIVQICILPLDSNIEPIQNPPPFYLKLQPAYPENTDPQALKINKLDLADLMLNGYDRIAAIDLFEEWVERLDLPYTKYGRQKQIMPLGHNYIFDSIFIQDWLGFETYQEYFFYRIRDIMVTANWLNDRAASHAELVPYSKISLSWIAGKLGIKHKDRHDALQDCLTCAKVYKEMLRVGLF